MPGDRFVYGQRFAKSWQVMTNETDVYACPLCLTRYPLAEIETLTWDHYPPRSIGGRDGDTVLVCEECRSKWASIDLEIARLRDVEEFQKAYPGTVPFIQRFPGTPGLQNSTMRVAVSVAEGGIMIIGRPEENPTQAVK